MRTITSIIIILFTFGMTLISEEDFFEEKSNTTSQTLVDIPSDLQQNIERLKPPSTEEIDTAIIKIREIFAEKLKLPDKTIKAELAETFIGEAEKTSHTANVRYAFFVEAQRLLIEAVKPEQLAKCIDKMDTVFEINKISLLSEKLTLVGKNAKSATEFLSITTEYQKLYENYIQNELFDEAQNALNHALNYARRAKDSKKEEEIKTTLKEFMNLKKQYIAVLPFIQKLQQNQEDKVANLNVGKYYCFVADNWKKGLPYLERSSDEDFVKAASLERKNQKSVKEMIELGDLWLKLSEKKQNKEYQKKLAMRASEWYENALPSLEGLEKLRVEKLIDDAYQSFLQTTTEIPKGTVIAFSFDPDTIYKVSGKHRVRDVSNSKNDGLMYDVEIQKLSASDFCVKFDGLKSRIEVKNPQQDLSNDFSIAMWLNPEDDRRRRNPYNKAYGGEGTITIEEDGYVNFYFGSAGGDKEPYISVGSHGISQLGKWTHLAITRDSEKRTILIYINGEKKIEKNYNFIVAPSGNNIIIGHGYAGGFKGRIDDLIITKTTLSEKEIKKIFKAGERKFFN